MANQLNTKAIKPSKTLPEDARVLIEVPGKNEVYKVKASTLVSSSTDSENGDTLLTYVAEASADDIKAGFFGLEVLPEPQNSNQYPIDITMAFEVTYNGTIFDSTDTNFFLSSAFGINVATPVNTMLRFRDDNIYHLRVEPFVLDSSQAIASAKAIFLSRSGGVPTIGDGGLRVITTYRLRTFGE